MDNKISVKIELNVGSTKKEMNIHWNLWNDSSEKVKETIDQLSEEAFAEENAKDIKAKRNF